MNTLEACQRRNTRRIFHASSACVYTELNQANSDGLDLKDKSAYAAQPDSVYGWKLFSESLYLSYARNYELEAL